MFSEPLSLLSFYQVINCGVGHENTTRRGQIEFWQANRNRHLWTLVSFQSVYKKQRQQKQASKTIYIYKHKQRCLTDNLLKA